MGDRIYTINPSYLSNNSFFQVPELNIPSIPVTLDNYSSMTDRVINPSLQRFPALQPQVTLNQTPASNTKPNKSINWNNAAGLANAGVGVFNAVNSSLGATNKTGNTLTSIGSAVGSLPIPGASIIGSGLGLIGGVANMFTNTVNKEHQRNIGRQISSLAGTTSNASSYEELQSDYNSLANANVGLGDIDQWGSKGIFSSGSKRKRARREAVEALETAKMQAAGSLASRGEGINQMNFANQYANLIADGGSIHIDSKNKGKFNATKRRTGKTTEELTHSKNPLTRKRAIFAQNAVKWNAFGGDLNTNGATWDTGITYIGNGGSHEANPYEGVQVGIDPSGVPNLVEEGEVIWDDYVFSKRLKVPKSFRSKYKLGNKELSFADAAMKFSEEGKERPNDPITKRGLDVMLSTLMDKQEEIRMKKQQKEVVNQFNSLPPEEQLGIMQMAQQNAMPAGPKEEYNNMEDNTIISPSVEEQAPMIAAYGGNLFPYGGKPRFFLRDTDANGNPIATLLEDIPEMYEGYSTATGQTWDEALASKGYTRVGKPQKSTIDGTDYIDYFLQRKTSTTSPATKEDTKITMPLKLQQTASRYAPVIGAGIGLITDALGITNTPDFSSAEEIKSAGLYNTPKIGYKPIGNYLSYNPLDINYLNNRIMQESAATRRAIQNNSAGNIGATTAGLLALDYNTQNAIGKAFRESLEYNDALKQKVEDFNRSTDMFNIQQSLAAQRANQAEKRQAAAAYAAGIAQAEALRQRAQQYSDTARSANLTNFLQGLSDIGNENEQRNWLKMLYASGYFGPSSNMESLLDSKNGILDIFRRKNSNDEDNEEQGSRNYTSRRARR